MDTYRFEFPSLSTYTGFVGEDSITNIVNNTFALAEDAIFTDYAFDITGDVLVAGNLTASSAVVDTITSNKSRATNILTNESNIYPNTDNITLNKTIATGIICGGGTLLFNLSISGFSATSDADTTLTDILSRLTALENP